ncbi:MAG: histidine kinase [Verrucomicrobiota bacterium]
MYATAMHVGALSALLLALAAGALASDVQDRASGLNEDRLAAKPFQFVTNVAQLRTITGADYLAGCAFNLTGVVTLVDTNRDLIVLQDETGAVALNFSLRECQARVGQSVSIEGSNCHPYVLSFPDYPLRPSGWDIRGAFEAPTDWGEYYLTRMRGYLRPPATGEYTFWIASDNSSELWLSFNEDVSKVRRIASIPRFGWVNPHEWFRYPSQRSDPIHLEAGRSYYVEAFQEQTTVRDNLSVAWQGPTIAQSVIDGQYLAPWAEDRYSTGLTETNGILREYWTNFSAGNLAIITGPRPFEGALTVELARVSIHGPGRLPTPGAINLGESLKPEDNYRWVEVEGGVKFVGLDGDVVCMELSDGQSDIEVRAWHMDSRLLHGIHNLSVRAQGVCEGAYNRNGILAPGFIWACAENSVSFISEDQKILDPNSIGRPVPIVATSSNSAMTGFYSTRGVVTFNDRVFGNDYMFVQEDSAPVFVTLENRHFTNQMRVGQLVELAGALLPGKHIPVIRPMVVTEVGWHPLPIPMTQASQLSQMEMSDGHWTEVEGVAHSVNSNGTLSVAGMGGPICLWVGQTSSGDLSRFVDAKLRVRGVLSLTAPDAPMLLVPSRRFVEVEKEAPETPFAIPISAIADLLADRADSSLTHRVRLAGAVTYIDRQSFFLQDKSGGVRVQATGNPGLKIADVVEVAGFPAPSGRGKIVSEGLVRFAHAAQPLEAKELDLSEPLSVTQSGTLVHASASLLSQKLVGATQVLELQVGGRIFAATLSAEEGKLPEISPGSRLRVTGVCEAEPMNAPVISKIPVKNQSLGSINIWLRDPRDVTLLGGPPWWTLKRTAALIAALLAMIVGAVLWIRLLHWRLDRHQAARLAFSRQILSNQESERRRIAANLHDALGQTLLVIANQAQLAMHSAGNEPLLQKRLGEISGIAVQAIEEVRQITLDLRPYHLDRLGLTEAIRATVSRASENSRIQFTTHIDDIDGIFGKDSEIHVYRIAQEAINNVVKHSAANEAAVIIKKEPAAVSLSVRDNGRGFVTGTTPPASPSGPGYGLSGIAERVQILGGAWVIDSSPGQGASLNVQIPIPPNGHEIRSENTGGR